MLISARGLTVRHGETTVLGHGDFQIGEGEIVTVVGPNGSGKSTLMRALIGLERPSEGTVAHKPGLRIGYVPQRLHIDAGLPMTVRRFLSLPRRVSDADASAALARVGVPGVGDRQMVRLSGGQFQRVLVARALLARPEILILDEPTQGLDQPGAAAFYRLIEEVRGETGVAVLMVSHDLHVVMSASDRVICLNRHVCCSGRPDRVVRDPAYRDLFGDAATALAVYAHHHDHVHDATGAVVPGGHDHHGHGHYGHHHHG